MSGHIRRGLDITSCALRILSLRYYHRPAATENDVVQWAHRLASKGISLRHSGHFFVDSTDCACGFLVRSSTAFIGRAMIPDTVALLGDDAMSALIANRAAAAIVRAEM